MIRSNRAIAKLVTPRIYLVAASILAPSTVNATDPASRDYPPILKSVEQQGLKILGEMNVPGGLRAFAAKAGAQPLAIYLTPDNNHVVVGTLVDAQGQDMAEVQLKKMAETPILEDSWKKLEQSTWVQDGDPKAPKTVYAFTDPNCPYCNKFWHAARPWVDSGKVQLRHVMVGVIRQDSPAKAASILNASSPGDALKQNELTFKDGGIQPASTVTDEIAGKLNNNAELMTALGFGGTPAIVYRKSDGTIASMAGLPESAALDEIFGSK